MRIKWHRKARQDLKSLQADIAADNPRAAQRVAQRILEVVELLMDNPALGRGGRVIDTRELVIPTTPYIAAYTVRDDAIVILRVLHGSRRWPESFH